jgi:pimeloyl-ACP methyl ester carboxylesterase
MGVYGNELGAYAALRAATDDPRIHALVLDSVPASPDELLGTAVKKEIGIVDNPAVQYLTRLVARAYLLRSYDSMPSCQLAAMLHGRRIFLLSGTDAGYLRESTAALARCFPPAELETNTDLPLTAFNLPFSTGEQEERYDRQLIEFFDKTLRKPAQAKP